MCRSPARKWCNGRSLDGAAKKGGPDRTEAKSDGCAEGQEQGDGSRGNVRSGDFSHPPFSGRGASRPDQNPPPRFLRPPRLVLRAWQTVWRGEGRAEIHEVQDLRLTTDG